MRSRSCDIDDIAAINVYTAESTEEAPEKSSQVNSQKSRRQRRERRLSTLRFSKKASSLLRKDVF